ncbi:hypothetical protein HDV00_004993 [Rhizophlyctis rosea]|nr:hypothetical protein HDV00_004993 [Rhizophlyctis rosea]
MPPKRSLDASDSVENTDSSRTRRRTSDAAAPINPVTVHADDSDVPVNSRYDSSISKAVHKNFTKADRLKTILSSSPEYIVTTRFTFNDSIDDEGNIDVDDHDDADHSEIETRRFRTLALATANAKRQISEWIEKDGTEVDVEWEDEGESEDGLYYGIVVYEDRLVGDRVRVDVDVDERHVDV